MISRNMLADGGFHDFSDLHLNFGIANATVVDSIIIYWPSGIVQEIGNIDANQFITIIEDESVGIESNEITNGYIQPSVYPNPVNEFSTLVFSLTNKSIVSISIISSKGTTVKQLSNEFFLDGNHEVKIDVEGLQPGIYFVKIISDYNAEVIRFIVL